MFDQIAARAAQRVISARQFRLSCRVGNGDPHGLTAWAKSFARHKGVLTPVFAGYGPRGERMPDDFAQPTRWSPRGDLENSGSCWLSDSQLLLDIGQAVATNFRVGGKRALALGTGNFLCSFPSQERDQA